MARIRTIKPEFPQSESMGRVSRDARLCFVLLWTIADDSGRLRGNSRMLASLLFPYDDDAKKLIDKWLGELEREHCITRYQIDGDSYLQVDQWARHQKIDKPSASKIDPPREDSRDFARIREPSSEDQGRDQGEDQGREGTISPKPPSGADRRFEDFWNAYPCKVGKDAARKAFDKRKPDDGLLAQMLAAVRAQIRSPAWQKDAGQFIPHPATWLTQGRWQDSAAAPAIAPQRDAAAETRRMLAEREMTPEQKAKANEAATAALARLGRSMRTVQ